MPKIQYKKFRFSDLKLGIISSANQIIGQYMSEGYKLTVRQLYYRFVANDLFPADMKYTWTGSRWEKDVVNGTNNAEPNYKWLGDLISDGRMAGMIDWDAIEDRTRELNAVAHWSTPADLIRTCERAFSMNKWVRQKHYVEVWVEKDALEGIVQRAAHSMDVAAFSCRGYTSQSSMWEAAQRLQRQVNDRKAPIILHLGDHDPSGIDMTRDIETRLNHFLCNDWLTQHELNGSTFDDVLDDIEGYCGGRGIKVERIALNRDQVNRYKPPPNPAKKTDSRYKKYRRIHGPESWELDALEPAVLTKLITDSIEEYLDNPTDYNRIIDQEAAHRNNIGKAAKHWDNHVVKTLAKLEG